jgi:hypothetical protein
MNILGAVSMKLNKLKRYFKTVPVECVGRIPKFFHWKLKEFNKQKQAFAKITTYIKTIACIIQSCLQNFHMYKSLTKLEKV